MKNKEREQQQQRAWRRAQTAGRGWWPFSAPPADNALIKMQHQARAISCIDQISDYTVSVNVIRCKNTIL